MCVDVDDTQRGTAWDRHLLEVAPSLFRALRRPVHDRVFLVELLEPPPSNFRTVYQLRWLRRTTTRGIRTPTSATTLQGQRDDRLVGVRYRK